MPSRAQQNASNCRSGLMPVGDRHMDDRGQSGSMPLNVTGCVWARVIIDDYGCRAGVDSQNVDMALTWDGMHKTRLFKSCSKHLILRNILVAGADFHKFLPMSQADWVDQESLAA